MENVNNNMLLKVLYKLPSLSGSFLKFFAIFCMTIDHFALIFHPFDDNVNNVLRFIGRMTIPVICFTLVEGFHYTQNYKRYFVRLLVFAFIAQFPFTSMMYGLTNVLEMPELMLLEGNVLFNLLMALLTLWIINSKLQISYKIVSIVILVFLSLKLDWGLVPISMVIVLDFFHNDKNQRAIAYIILTMSLLILNDLGCISIQEKLTENWVALGLLVPPIFWLKYNGKRGKRFGGRYFFYWYYPIHILILALTKSVIVI